MKNKNFAVVTIEIFVSQENEFTDDDVLRLKQNGYHCYDVSKLLQDSTANNERDTVHVERYIPGFDPLSTKGK